MMSIFASGYRYLSSVLSDFFYTVDDDSMTEISYFGKTEWKNHFNINVDAPRISEEIQLALEKPCPFWANKKIKETHILFLVPQDISLDTFLTPPFFNSNPSMIKYSLSGLKIAPDYKHPYWALMTKKTIPNSSSNTFENQKAIAKQYGYEIPKTIEAIACILSAKLLGNISIFCNTGEQTRCEEEIDSSHIIIGGGSSSSFFSIALNDWNEVNGVAGIVRFKNG